MSEEVRFKIIRNVSLGLAFMAAIICIFAWHVQGEAILISKQLKRKIDQLPPAMTKEDLAVINHPQPARFLIDLSNATPDTIVIVTLVSPSTNFTSTSVFHDSLEIKCADPKKTMQFQEKNQIYTCADMK